MTTFTSSPHYAYLIYFQFKFQLRLTPQLARFMVDTPSLHRLTSSVTALIIFFSVFSSILSTFGYIQFIPAMFAISGAATAWTSYSQTDLVLVQTNAAINQLNQLVIWWDALSMIEKRIGANKEFLVRHTLHLTLSYLNSFDCSTIILPLQCLTQHVISSIDDLGHDHRDRHPGSSGRIRNEDPPKR